MATGLSQAMANAALDAICNAVPLSIGTVYVKLHLGEPGVNGDANPAADARRIAASFGVAANGTVTNDLPVTWTNMQAAETPLFFTAHSDPGGGTFLFSGVVVNPVAYQNGNTYNVPAGQLVCTLPFAT